MVARADKVKLGGMRLKAALSRKVAVLRALAGAKTKPL